MELSLIDSAELRHTYAPTNTDMKRDASMFVEGGGCDFGTAPACENKSALFCTGE